MALQTYGAKPISFQLEEGGDFYCVGSEVGNYLGLFRGALYKKYPGMVRKTLTSEERKRLIDNGLGPHIMSSTVTLLKASEVEEIIKGNDDNKIPEHDCGEIEYLDEDEELVHQYVQNITEPREESLEDLIPIARIPIDPLLTERKIEYNKVQKTSSKRKQTSDDDSDYDPTIDLMLQRKKKAKIQSNKRPLLKLEAEPKSTKIVFKTSLDESKYKTMFNKTSKDELNIRKNSDVRIPNYEDAICLSGKAFKRDENDVKRLRNWNKICLERLKSNDLALAKENKPVVKSSQSFVFRNVQNPVGGRVETSMWHKSLVENEEGLINLETYQTVIPYFREKNIVQPYQLRKAPRSSNITKFEIVLAKETSKDDEYLVAYNTQDYLSAVYKSYMRDDIDSEDIDANDNRRMCLKETTCCQVCAPCYQVSWRGVRTNNKDNNISCSICSRDFISVYNFLSHLKSHHTDADVRKHKRIISRTLAENVDYHYKCRICQEQFEGIKELRTHITTHQGSESFKCEVGNHMAN